MNKEELMRLAVSLACENVKNGGGPFGAVITKDNNMVSMGVNRVTADDDPTAHAEINAIRIACRKLGTFNLSGCEIYTSCEPCPMCLGAIYWAHIDAVYYGCSKEDAAAADFDDSFIYHELSLSPANRAKVMQQLLPHEALEAFRLWDSIPDKKTY